MRIISNPHRPSGLPTQILAATPYPSVDAERPANLLKQCPAYKATPLTDMKKLAGELGIGSLAVKDERTRLNLGSFKALGAAYVIADMANSAPDQQLTGKTFATASAGNHGLSVARGAQIFGAKSVIYIADTVPAGFQARLEAFGATVVRKGHDYEASMTAAQEAATKNNWILLSDSSWDGYFEMSHRLMEGYLTMAAETVRQMDKPPTHIFLQAGVGGMASAVAAYFRKAWEDGPTIIVVEPDAAPALLESVKAGEPVDAPGPVSNMGRLDCKTPSFIALKGLARDADHFMTISDGEASKAAARLAAHDMATSPSGGAGLAGLIASKEALELGWNSRALLIISEIPSE